MAFKCLHCVKMHVHVSTCMCFPLSVSQWEVPPDFQVPAAHPTQSSSTSAPFSSATPHSHSVTTSALASDNQDRNGGEQAAMTESESTGDRKRPVKDGKEEDYSQPPPQKRPNPYGAWTTVALRCA